MLPRLPAVAKESLPALRPTAPLNVLVPESVTVPGVDFTKPKEPASTPEIVPLRASTSVREEKEPAPLLVMVPEESTKAPTVSAKVTALSVPPATVTVEASSKAVALPKARVPALTVVPAL